MEPGDYETQFHVVRLVEDREASFRGKLRSASSSSMNARCTGEHREVVSERIDYLSVTFAFDTQSHVMPGPQITAAQRLDQILHPGSLSHAQDIEPVAFREFVENVPSRTRLDPAKVSRVECGSTFWI